MTSLPRGTVAFLMSDIEGSTRLSASAGSGFPALLDAHFAVMRGAIEAEGGTIVSTEGDSVFAVLPTARSAVVAATAAQRGLEQHEWPDALRVRVRIGVHVGEAVFGGRDYTGIDVNKTARVMAAAWGGETIVSEAVEALVGDSLEDRLTLRDLGVHSLRDIAAPERLYQVVASGLRADFPPPRTQSAAAPTNLPVPLTRFVGRGRELSEIQKLVTESRLVTLTGPGGTGKTRLAIEAARASLEAFSDGVFFVALDTVRDPDLVVPQIAQTLGLVEDSAKSISDTVAAYLSGKRLLLVLDNLEQVISAAPRIAALLGAAQTFAILGSSREPLGVAGETIYAVPPLALPSEPGTPTAHQIASMEAVQLFVERARAARSNFELTDDNAAAVAAVCRRVDGLPLAIELAAARANVLAPQQILERLDHRLTLLSGSRRDVTDRQRTLRGAIDWSHDLLSPDEQTGFRRFSVFAGGASLDAVLAVLNVDGELSADALDLVASLVERSLVRASDDAAGTRFSMLETIREYAVEKLAESTEFAKVRDAHADFFCAMAEAAINVLYSPDRDSRLDALDTEMPNFRAALEWSVECGAFERAARTCVGLKEFWRTRSHLPEARRLMDRIIDAWPGEEWPQSKAWVLGIAAELAAWHTDYARSRELTEAEIDLLTRIGDKTGLAQAFTNVGWSNVQDRPDVAIDGFEKAIASAREVGDGKNLLVALQGLALAFFRTGQLEKAKEAAESAITVGNDERDEYTNAFNILALGMIYLELGDAAQGVERFAEALKRSQKASANIGIVVALDALAMAALNSGDVASAATLGLVADRIRLQSGGAPTLALIGRRPILDQIRESDPAALSAASSTVASVSTEDAIATAYAVAAAIANSASATQR